MQASEYRLTLRFIDATGLEITLAIEDRDGAGPEPQAGIAAYMEKLSPDYG